jgi:hypothetical protein
MSDPTFMRLVAALHTPHWVFDVFAPIILVAAALFGLMAAFVATITFGNIAILHLLIFIGTRLLTPVPPSVAVDVLFRTFFIIGFLKLVGGSFSYFGRGDRGMFYTLNILAMLLARLPIGQKGNSGVTSNVRDRWFAVWFFLLALSISLSIWDSFFKKLGQKLAAIWNSCLSYGGLHPST